MKIIITILFLIITNITIAQTNWLNNTNRDNNYPDSVYYYGLVYKVLGNETEINTVSSELRKESLSVLISSIYSKVNTESENISMDINNNASSKYYSKTSVNSKLDIPGAKTDSYYNKENKTLYFFSYIKKNEIADYYVNRYKEQLRFFNNNYESQLEKLPIELSSFVMMDKIFSELKKIEETREAIINIGISKYNTEGNLDIFLNRFHENLNLLTSSYISSLSISTEKNQIMVPFQDSIFIIPIQANNNALTDLSKIPIKSSSNQYPEQVVRTDHNGTAHFRYNKLKGADTLGFEFKINSQEYLNIPDSSAFFKNYLSNYFQNVVHVKVIYEKPIVYFNFQETIEDEINTKPVIEPEIKEMLNSGSIKFTNNKTEANYEIKLLASCRYGSAYQSVYVAYSKASISVIDTNSKLEVYSKSFTEKRGLGSSYEQAAVNSLTDLSKQIKTGIYETIKDL